MNNGFKQYIVFGIILIIGVLLLGILINPIMNIVGGLIIIGIVAMLIENADDSENDYDQEVKDEA